MPFRKFFCCGKHPGKNSKDKLPNETLSELDFKPSASHPDVIINIDEGGDAKAEHPRQGLTVNTAASPTEILEDSSSPPLMTSHLTVDTSSPLPRGSSPSDEKNIPTPQSARHAILAFSPKPQAERVKASPYFSRLGPLKEALVLLDKEALSPSENELLQKFLTSSSKVKSPFSPVHSPGAPITFTQRYVKDEKSKTYKKRSDCFAVTFKEGKEENDKHHISHFVVTADPNIVVAESESDFKTLKLFRNLFPKEALNIGFKEIRCIVWVDPGNPAKTGLSPLSKGAVPQIRGTSIYKEPEVQQNMRPR
jgi:hypothetical protein